MRKVELWRIRTVAKKRLITSSLIGGIKWAETCPPSWKKKAFQDLTNTLARIWTEPEGPAKLGIDFENWVYKVLGHKVKPDNINSSEMFKEIIRRYYSRTLEIQKKVKRFITIDNHEYCLYGKLDICFGVSYIEDIKTTSKIMNSYESKYLEGIQHHLYCYITEIPNFSYFIVVFNDKGEIHSTHEVEYYSPGMEYEREVIEEAIREVFVFFGQHPNLLKLYSEKYCLY